MEPDLTAKSADLGEEDLVDYEEEDETTAIESKPSDGSKDISNKYASALPLCFYRFRLAPSPGHRLQHLFFFLMHRHYKQLAQAAVRIAGLFT